MFQDNGNINKTNASILKETELKIVHDLTDNEAVFYQSLLILTCAFIFKK